MSHMVLTASPRLSICVLLTHLLLWKEDTAAGSWMSGCSAYDIRKQH